MEMRIDMKIIDLLNKIANGEEVPKKILLNENVFEYQGDDYLYKDEDKKEHWLFSAGYTDRYMWLENFLKAEVEIFEDPKKIEKLETYKEKKGEDYFANILKLSPNSEFEIDEALSTTIDKLNELIDEINNSKEKKEK